MVRKASPLTHRLVLHTFEAMISEMKNQTMQACLQ